MAHKGKPAGFRLTVEERVFSNLRQDGDCWTWTGALNQGYGRLNVSLDRRVTKNVQAHRWVFELLRGEIPEGLVLDHLCRNRACVNPWHRMRGES